MPAPTAAPTAARSPHRWVGLWSQTGMHLLVGLTVVAVFASTALTNLMALLLSAAALVYWWRDRPGWLLREPLLAASLALLGWLLLREFAAGSGVRAALAELSDFRTLLFAVLWAPVFLRPGYRRTAFWTAAACLLVYCLLAVAPVIRPLHALSPSLMFFYWVPPLTTYYAGVADVAGPMLTVGIVGSLAAALRDGTRPRQRMLWVAAAALGLATLLWVTERRTGYVTLTAALSAWMLLMALRQRPRAALVGLAVMTIALAAAALAPPVQKRVAQALAEVQQYQQTAPEQRGQVETSMGLRLRFWSTTSDIIREAPVTGVALSRFPERFMHHTALRGGATSDHGSGNPHNEYLYLWASLGLPGLLLYLALLARMLQLAWRTVDPLPQTLLLAATVACFTSVLFNSMLIDMKAGHFFTLMLLVLAQPAWLVQHANGAVWTGDRLKANP